METMYKIQHKKNSFDVRERFEKYGLEKITTQELLMLILGSGVKDCAIDELSWRVLNALDFRESDSIYPRLCKIKGMGKTKAATICACLELGKRLESNNKKIIRNASDVIPLVNHYSLENVEFFILITLDAASQIIKISEISKGATNSAQIHPKEVFSQVLKDNGTAVIFVHNHPSGNVLPSLNDINLTQVLYKGGKLLGINTLDHIIISLNSYYSMMEHGIFDEFENENYESENIGALLKKIH